MMDGFFEKKECERCGGGLEVRTMSWFLPETICMECSGREAAFKDKMRSRGFDPDAYEGCGKERLEQLGRALGFAARWEVQENTLCGGWTNTWSEDGKPETFATKEDAQAELDEFFVDAASAALDYEREDFRVVSVEDGR